MKHTTPPPAPLFDFPRCAQHDNPVALQAEAQMNRTGRRSRTLDRVLALLELGPCTSTELATVTFRYSARIYDLRRLGYVIDTDLNCRTGISTFTLKGTP